MSRRTLVALIIAGQLLFMAGLIARQEYKWRAWRTIQLRVVPLDPVALFRGRYVHLTYDFSVLSARGEDWKRGETVYVRLKPQGDGTWKAAEVSRTLDQQPEEVLLRGMVVHAYGGRVFLRTGIESYFMSERKAPEIERLSPQKYDMRVDVAVSNDGRAALKQLYIDGIPAEDFQPRPRE